MPVCLPMHSSRSAAPPGLCPLQTTPLKVLGLLGTSRPWAAAGSTPAFRLGFEVVARSGTRPPPVTSWSLLLKFYHHHSSFSPSPFLTAGASDLLPRASYPLAAIFELPRNSPSTCYASASPTQLPLPQHRSFLAPPHCLTTHYSPALPVQSHVFPCTLSFPPSGKWLWPAAGRGRPWPTGGAVRGLDAYLEYTVHMCPRLC